MIWLWDAVTTNVCGGLEPAPIIYRVRLAQRIIVDWLPGPDGDPVPIYQTTPWNEIINTDALQADVPVPTPAPGEVVLIDLETTDAAGNRSEDAGPC